MYFSDYREEFIPSGKFFYVFAFPLVRFIGILNRTGL